LVSSACHLSSSPRYLAFVTGGATPLSLAAHWLVAAADQNAWSPATAPLLAGMEEVVVGWLAELLSLPAGSGGALCGGATLACTAALCAARDKVLKDAGWDAREHGLCGAPAVRVYVGGGAHSSVFKALSIVGLGASPDAPHVTVLPALPSGAIDAAALPGIPPPAGPAIVLLQAGHVSTGAFDDFRAALAWARAGPADPWVHVDGAFGLWARASPSASVAALCDGAEGADSWSTDLHKALNVPYDSAFVCTRHPELLHAAMTCEAPYDGRGEGRGRRTAELQ
jgi:glutamate/tyrosine decarboxylase-like PLP-dependent enzyme